MRKLRLLLLVLIVVAPVNSQPKQELINVNVFPESTDWEYNTGEIANFHVIVLKNGQPLENLKAEYKIGPEQMPPQKEGEVDLTQGKVLIKGLSMKRPGFLRCEVSVQYEGKTYTGTGTAGFNPEKIKPVTKMPDDFDTFWNNAKNELAEIPMDAKLTLMPEYCDADVNVYHLNLQNIEIDSWPGKSRFYGILSVPKKPGKYPALLNVPGAGVRPYYPDGRAKEGFICLTVGIHGIPVTMEQDVYSDLQASGLAKYWMMHLDDRDLYYFKRVYLGCVRAIDYIFSMPEFDGENLGINGGSQGGALSIIIAGLDQRVKYLAAFYPALSDMLGYTVEDRAGGWPHMFKEYDEAKHPNWKNVAPYYDVVNFARKLTIPGWYSWGFNDNVCPPTSLYAAYNVIEAPKELHLFLETGHWTFPEQWEMANKWLMGKLRE